MKFERLKIKEVIKITPKKHGDNRGYFSELWRSDVFGEFLGHNVNFVQDNESKSSYGVLRGLHFQTPPYAQSKLVRVLSGEILDVAVDVRLGSPTFGLHVSEILSKENGSQLFVPRGFAHGFVVLSDTATINYKVDNFYAPSNDSGILWNDEALEIDWKLPSGDIILSKKDKIQPKLQENKNNFRVDVDYYEQ